MQDTHSIEVRRLVITGYVQGVGYRWSMVHAARNLRPLGQIRGWVRNRPNGSVEALVAGPAAAVAALIDWARQGPPSAEVEHVSVEMGQLSEVAGCMDFEQTR